MHLVGEKNVDVKHTGSLICKGGRDAGVVKVTGVCSLGGNMPVLTEKEERRECLCFCVILLSSIIHCDWVE